MALGELVAGVLLWVTKLVICFQTIGHASHLEIGSSNLLVDNQVFFQGNVRILFDTARVRGYIWFVFDSYYS